MNRMYAMLGESRQNVGQRLQREAAKSKVACMVVKLAAEIRRDHPRMGCRKMYWKGLKEMAPGRDRCEEILLSNGFRVKFPPNFKRTTYSIGKMYHPNLIEGLTVDGLNQVWQTDITYFEVKSKFYYLVFIEDVYSRRIVGWSVDYSLWAQSNLRALQQAIDARGRRKLKGLIHHSDRGGQYIDKEYTALLSAYEIKPSMCLYAWQNAYCERLNGIIKNEYLKCWRIADLGQLKQALDRAVYLYNNERPHRELSGRLSPVQFEDKLRTGLFRFKPTMRLYSKDVDTR